MYVDELEDYLHAQASNEQKAPLDVLYSMMLEEAKYQEVIIRPSGIIEFFDNTLAWAVKQLLGVQFGSSYASIIGDIVHKSADYMYNYYLDNGKYPIERRCLIEGCKKGKYLYKNFLHAKYQDKTSDKYESYFQIYKEAKRLFEAYYKQVALDVVPFLVEHKMSYQFIDDNDMPMGIKLQGTTDRIDETPNGKVVVDIKTSKINVSGELIKDEKIESIKSEIKSLSVKQETTEKEKSLKEALKIAKKKPSISDNMKKLKSDLTSAKRKSKLAKATDEEKSIALKDVQKVEEKTTLLSLQEQKVYELNLQKAQEELEKYQQSIEKKINDCIESLKNELKPLQAELDKKQHELDCIEARKKYGKQLAAYSILYLLLYNEEIKIGRIELLVRRKEAPLIRVFEFDITSEIKKLMDDIDLIVETVNAFRNGVHPKLLFKHNPETFRGSDLTEIIEEVEKEVYTDVEIINSEQNVA